MENSAHAALGGVSWGMDGLLGVTLVAAFGFALMAVGWAMLRDNSDSCKRGPRQVGSPASTYSVLHCRGSLRTVVLQPL
jgi:hypothetical protein